MTHLKRKTNERPFIEIGTHLLFYPNRNIGVFKIKERGALTFSREQGNARREGGLNSIHE